MVTISGGAGSDTIDVTSDVGTLDSGSGPVPQGSPVDSIAAGGGADVIDISGNSTISGDVRGQGGADAITVEDSTLGDDLFGNGGADTISVTNSTIADRIAAGGANDTVTVTGSTVGTVRLGTGDDVLNFVNSDANVDLRGGTGTDALNLPIGTTINDDDPTIGTFIVGTGPYSVSSGTFTLPTGQTITYSTFENGTGIPCFMRGTFIQTPLGPAPIESLRVGEMVLTQQNGLQEIRWAGGRRLDAGELAANPKLRPIRIVAGALGNGLPTRDMLVSRQHRMLVQSRIAERMFGVTEVFIPAIKLIALPGIFIDEEVQEAEYYHLLFDRHEVIFAEGAPTESLYTGPEALKALGPEARTEILTLFPELATLDYKPEPACFIPQGRQQVKLVSRHLKNARALLEA